MWPSIPLVVSQATIGTAMGVTTSIQMIGMGISNLIVGQILGSSEKQVFHRIAACKTVLGRCSGTHCSAAQCNDHS